MSTQKSSTISPDPDLIGPEGRVLVAIVLGCTISGLVLSAIVLSLFAYAAWKPVSRPHLDRVSFRLLTYALVSTNLFGIVLISSVTIPPGPSAACSFIPFFANLNLHFASCLFFCIAINLQLVLVHHVNGRKVEKYYIIGSAILSATVNITVYAAGHYGWDDEHHTCWIRDTDDKVRLRWLLGGQSVWLFLFCLGETIAFIVVLGYMVRYQIKFKRAGNWANSSTATSHSTLDRSPLNKYRSIILRIALYPFVSWILNVTTVTVDTYSVLHKISSSVGRRAIVLDITMYSLRPLLYALLAGSDPAFLRSMRALRIASKPDSYLLSPTGQANSSMAFARNQLTDRECNDRIAKVAQLAELGDPELKGASQDLREQDSDELDRRDEHTSESYSGEGAHGQKDFKHQL